MDCLAGCCEPSDPGEKITCCDPTAVIFGIVVGVASFIIAVLKLCLWFMKRFASKYHLTCSHVVFWVMVFNATFNNNSVISWGQVLLVEEIGVPGENQRPDVIHKQTSHTGYGLSSTPRHERDFNSQL